jgi:hypothetical protein
LPFQALDLFVFRRGQAESGLRYLRRQNGIFRLPLHIALFPFIRQLSPDSDAAYAFFYPIVRVPFRLVQLACPLRGKLRVFDLLHALVADLCQPPLEWFGLGRRDGLNDAEDALRVGA